MGAVPKVWDLGEGFWGFRGRGVGHRVLGFRVQGLAFRVDGRGFRVLCFRTYRVPLPEL